MELVDQVVAAGDGCVLCSSESQYSAGCKSVEHLIDYAGSSRARATDHVSFH